MATMGMEFTNCRQTLKCVRMLDKSMVKTRETRLSPMAKIWILQTR